MDIGRKGLCFLMESFFIALLLLYFDFFNQHTRYQILLWHFQMFQQIILPNDLFDPLFPDVSSFLSVFMSHVFFAQPPPQQLFIPILGLLSSFSGFTFVYTHLYTYLQTYITSQHPHMGGNVQFLSSAFGSPCLTLKFPGLFIYLQIS